MLSAIVLIASTQQILSPPSGGQWEIIASTMDDLRIHLTNDAGDAQKVVLGCNAGIQKLSAVLTWTHQVKVSQHVAGRVQV